MKHRSLLRVLEGSDFELAGCQDGAIQVGKNGQIVVGAQTAGCQQERHLAKLNGFGRIERVIKEGRDNEIHGIISGVHILRAGGEIHENGGLQPGLGLGSL